jgi:hypothetical protein
MTSAQGQAEEELGLAEAGSAREDESEEGAHVCSWLQ